MLTVERLVVGALRTNCYILTEDEVCVIIDPGAEAELILKRLDNLGKELKTILLTHGHFDHTGAVHEIRDATCAEVIACEKEVELLASADLSSPFSPVFSNEELIPDRLVKDGDMLFFGDMKIEVLETPGHTFGSVCYLVDDYLFTGDTLFKGSIGRTDIGGDYFLMKNSLKKILKLPGNFKIYPGHGDMSSIKVELKSNPYLMSLEKVDEI